MSERLLYGYWRSSAAYRVRIALNLKGLDYEQTSIDLKTGAQGSPGFKIMNPQGLVPLLVDGDRAFNQSMAIVEYLDETYPDPPLLGQTPEERARIRAAAQIIGCDIHPLDNVRVLKYLKTEMGQDQDAIDAWYLHWIWEGFRPLEELAERSPGPYLFGDRITLADICLPPQMYNARRFRMDLEAFPALVAADKALMENEAVKAARPEAQPDAET